jgi:MFS family permease
MRAPSAPVVALASTTTVGYGVLFYAYGVLLLPMDEELGWGRPFLSGAFSLALVVSALLTIPVGRWLDRHPPRTLFLTAAVASALLVALWSRAQARTAFVLVWLLLGACQAVLFYEPAFTVLTKWYAGHDRHRAITTVTLAGGLASTVFGPLTTVLERTLGWRSAVLVLGALLAVLTIPCFVVGLRPRVAAVRDEAVEVVDALPRDVLVTRTFWILTLAYLLNAITTFAVAVHLVSYLRGHGHGAGVAATALGGIGLVQVLGRSSFLRLSARRSSTHLGTCCSSCQASSASGCSWWCTARRTAWRP